MEGGGKHYRNAHFEKSTRTTINSCCCSLDVELSTCYVQLVNFRLQVHYYVIPQGKCKRPFSKFRNNTFLQIYVYFCSLHVNLSTPRHFSSGSPRFKSEGTMLSHQSERQSLKICRRRCLRPHLSNPCRDLGNMILVNRTLSKFHNMGQIR